jgi:hypothetical protein
VITAALLPQSQEIPGTLLGGVEQGNAAMKGMTAKAKQVKLGLK